MNPPPPPSPSSSSAFASVPMVAITVVGILATFVVLASYYAFVTKCHLVRSLSARQRRRRREPSVIRTVTAEDRGLGPPLIHMIPIVKFAAADGGGSGAAAAPRISVSECAVCLSEFEEQERVRLLPNCSHAFHIDCIDTWLQGNTRCPFCRRDITLPVAGRAAAAALASCSSEHQELSNRIVIELGSGHEEWTSHAPNRRARRKAAAESLGDEAIDTRTSDAEFAVQPMRRSLSMDSCCDKQLYLSVQEILTQRQV